MSNPNDSGVGVDTDQARIKTKMSELLKHSEMFWDPVDAILMSDWWIARETEVSGLVGKLAEAERQLGRASEQLSAALRCFDDLQSVSGRYKTERDEALAQLAKIRERCELNKTIADSKYAGSVSPYIRGQLNESAIILHLLDAAVLGVPQPEPAQVPDWCQPGYDLLGSDTCTTCDGTEIVHQEHQIGAPSSGGDFPCPDCVGFRPRATFGVPQEQAPTKPRPNECPVGALRPVEPDGSHAHCWHETGGRHCCICGALWSGPTEPEVVHLIHAGDGRTACCGRTAFELPREHRITLDVTAANCARLAAPTEDGQRVPLPGEQRTDKHQDNRQWLQATATHAGGDGSLSANSIPVTSLNEVTQW